MVSPTVDAAILNHDSDEVPDLTLLWISLLRAVSANSAYRREIGPLVDANEVVNFLFKNESFPRSMLFCISGIGRVLKHLKNPQSVAAQLDVISLRC